VSRSTPFCGGPVRVVWFPDPAAVGIPEISRARLLARQALLELALRLDRLRVLRLLLRRLLLRLEGLSGRLRGSLLRLALSQLFLLLRVPAAIATEPEKTATATLLLRLFLAPPRLRIRLRLRLRVARLRIIHGIIAVRIVREAIVAVLVAALVRARDDVRLGRATRPLGRRFERVGAIVPRSLCLRLNLRGAGIHALVGVGALLHRARRSQHPRARGPRGEVPTGAPRERASRRRLRARGSFADPLERARGRRVVAAAAASRERRRRGRRRPSKAASGGQPRPTAPTERAAVATAGGVGDGRGKGGRG
jgi:hypothetical protein